ncbi:MAG: putative quercetin 2,3-dioxygenase [Frankiales bacterium]|nr:putative quercetin 2,3-dioxygenase [Frankiales bacterium]
MDTWDIRRAADRAQTRTAWLTSAHSFAYGHAYDPANTHFGLLIAHNEDVLAPNSGFDTHPHRDLEILTWVLSGELAHQDSAGHAGQLQPGVVQWLSAGSGVQHSELNPTAQPSSYVQMWVLPGTTGLPPSYQTHDVSRELAGGELVPVASGLARHGGGPAIRLNQPDAAFLVARLPAGGRLELPAAPFLHIFIASGAARITDPSNSDRLAAGDALRLRAAEAVRLDAIEATEVLVWEMHHDLG